jgi:hypothetical protein
MILEDGLFYLLRQTLLYYCGSNLELHPVQISHLKQFKPALNCSKPENPAMLNYISILTDKY